MKVIRDKEEWEKVLKNFAEVDVFYTYDFMKVNCIIEPGYPEAIYYEDQNLRFFYPYIRRPLSDLPYVPDRYRDYSDITSPYGTGGALFEGDVKGILHKLKEFFMDTKTISEFVRFHPLIENYKGFENYYELIKISPLIYIDFRDFKDEGEIFKSFRKGHRADIKFAIRNNYEIRKNSQVENYVSVFLEIYYETMKRNRVDKRHFFPKKFFLNLSKSEFADFYFVFYDNEIIFSAIFLKKFPFSTYFLSGSRGKRLRGANHFLLWSFIREIFNKGFKFFMLGGGVRGEDSLLHFKRGFSKKEEPYFISKKIYFKEIYEELVDEFLKYKNIKEKPRLFPQYRDI